MKIKALSVALAICSVSAQVASPYVRPGAIGQDPTIKQNNKCSNASRAELSIDCWIGQRVLFLPMSKSLQHFGYQSYFRLGDDNMRGLPYEELVGKIGKITSKQAKAIGGFNFVITLEGVDKKVVGYVVSEQLDDIVFLKDLDDARKKLIGKPLWLWNGNLNTIDETGSVFGSVELPRFTKVTVIDVVAGTYDHTPVRLILKSADGKIGYDDVAWSKTNVDPILQESSNFDSDFFSVDPHTLYRFSEQQWTAISKSKILIGMTPQMVKLARGRDPEKINRTTTGSRIDEQWVYENGKSNPNSYIYFSNGKVVSVQD
jgi:hypothetical protein